MERTVLRPPEWARNGDLSLAVQAASAEPTLVICEELTPTLAEELYRLSVAGVIQLGGGTTSHGAILARALGLPAIGGARKILDRLRSAQRVAISGSEGLLWIDPPADILSDLGNRQQLERSELQRALQESQERAITNRWATWSK